MKTLAPLWPTINREPPYSDYRLLLNKILAPLWPTINREPPYSDYRPLLNKICRGMKD
jgi:hypothetical protein